MQFSLTYSIEWLRLWDEIESKALKQNEIFLFWCWCKWTSENVNLSWWNVLYILVGECWLICMWIALTILLGECWCIHYCLCFAFLLVGLKKKIKTLEKSRRCLAFIRYHLKLFLEQFTVHTPPPGVIQ